jgi:hypothetical protein
VWEPFDHLYWGTEWEVYSKVENISTISQTLQVLAQGQKTVEIYKKESPGILPGDSKRILQV